MNQLQLNKGNILFQNAPTEILNAIFVNIPTLKRITVLSLVCKNWNTSASHFQKELFDIDAIAKSIIVKADPAIKLDKFLYHHHKLDFERPIYNIGSFTGLRSLPREIELSWENSSGSTEEFKCYKRFVDGKHQKFFIVKNSKRGNFHFEKNPSDRNKKYLIIECFLAFKETLKFISSGPEQYVTPDGWIFTTCKLLNSSCIYRNIKYAIEIGRIEKKSTVKGWKEISPSSKSRHRAIENAVFAHLKLFFESHIIRSAAYNCTLLESKKIEDFESSASLYCDKKGRIVSSGEHRFNILVKSIEIGKDKFIKTLSWEPSAHDEFYSGVASAIRHAALARTTHLLSRRLGLKLFDKSTSSSMFSEF